MHCLHIVFLPILSRIYYNQVSPSAVTQKTTVQVFGDGIVASSVDIFEPSLPSLETRHSLVHEALFPSVLTVCS